MAAEKKPQLVEVLHSGAGLTAGRVRLSIYSLYRSDPVSDWLKRGLSNQNGVSTLTANLRTGTLLIFYDPKQLTLKQVVAMVEELLKESPTTIRREFYQSRSGIKRTKSQLLPPKPWHALGKKQVLTLFGSSTHRGLTSEQARLHLQSYGANRLSMAQKRSEWEIFSKQFKNLPAALLLGSAGISIITGGLPEALVILGVVLFNAYLGYITESSAEKTVNLITRTNHPDVMVVREGKPLSIKIEKVVLGDLLLLLPGTRIPADARVLRVDHLQIDESILTGESLPVHKTHLKLNDQRLPLADRTNMVFRGTMVTSGRGMAVVVASGNSTELGLIQNLMRESIEPDTPLQKQLHSLTEKMVVVSLGISIVVFILGLLRGAKFLETLKTAISLAVAAIPEGLPAVATFSLARGVKRLEKHKLLIRHLDAVETLGNINVICFDKTGTLTLNEMTVAAIHTPHGLYSSAIQGFSHPELEQLTRTVALCNEAELGNESVTGSATESALLRLAIQNNINIEKLRSKFPLIATQYRTESRGYMLTVHQQVERPHIFVAAKGRPNEILKRCSHQMKDGQAVRLSSSDRSEIELANTEMAELSLRVLGVAYQELSPTLNPIEAKLIWLGLIGLRDPIRPGINELIKTLHIAGIHTVMITGDQNATALAIARELDLSEGKELHVIDSTMLETLDADLLSSIAPKAHIFSRMSPSHKLQIIKALQQSGMIVAMTGDGINDGPALRVANIGIAMGGRESETARSVADLVLTQSHLPALVHGIQEGRTVHMDLKKAVGYIVSQNLSEMLFTFVSVFAGYKEPLTPLQLLWVNLVTDILPELALSQDPPEFDILHHPPERLNDQLLLSLSDLKRVGLQSCVLGAASLTGYLYGVRKYGIGPRAKTLGFITLNTSSLLHTLSSRSDRLSIFDRSRLSHNHYIPLSIGIGFAAEMAAIYIPFIRRFLKTAPLSRTDLMVAGLTSVVPFFLIEASKFVQSRARFSRSLIAEQKQQPHRGAIKHGII